MSESPPSTGDKPQENDTPSTQQLNPDEIHLDLDDNDEDEYVPNDTITGAQDPPDDIVSNATTNRTTSNTGLSGLSAYQEQLRRHKEYDGAYNVFCEDSKSRRDVANQVESRNKTWDELREKANRRINEIAQERKKLDANVAHWEKVQKELNAEHEETMQKVAPDRVREEMFRRYLRLESDDVPA